MAFFRYASKLKKADEHNYLYKWDFTKSLVDEVGGSTAILLNGLQRTSNGLEFTASQQICDLGYINMAGKTIEVDVTSYDDQTGVRLTYGLNFIVNAEGTSKTRWGGLVYTSGTTRWNAKAPRKGYTTSINFPYDVSDVNAFNGKTVGVKYSSDYTLSLFINGKLIKTVGEDNTLPNLIKSSFNRLFLGGNPNDELQSNQLYNSIISKVRIYENED